MPPEPQLDLRGRGRGRHKGRRSGKDRRGGRETGKGGVGEMGRDRRGRKERRDGEKGERRGSGISPPRSFIKVGAYGLDTMTSLPCDIEWQYFTTRSRIKILCSLFAARCKILGWFNYCT